jgi:hypothetical protein
VKAADFDNPFGNSFQAYVGEIVRATCKPPRFSLLAEEPYLVGSRKMHGVDWILSDATGHLFIESKTKRLTVGAKTLGDPAALDNGEPPREPLGWSAAQTPTLNRRGQFKVTFQTLG